jgi:hypothetical protein
VKGVCCAIRRFSVDNIWFLNEPEPTKLNHTSLKKKERYTALENIQCGGHKQYFIL